MKKLAFLSLVAFLAFSVESMAQGFKLGPTLGANLANSVVESDIQSIDGSSFFGYRLGATAEVNITKSFGIQPSLLISTKGTEFEVAGQNRELRVSYFEVPILLDYSKGLGDLVRLHVLAGPYFAFGMGGKVKIGNNDEEDISFGDSADDDLKPTDFGASLGAGVSVKKILVTATYNIGLSDISTTNQALSLSNYQNGVFSVGLTYFFLDIGR